MGINETYFNPFNMMDCSMTSTNNSSFSTGFDDFNPFNPSMTSVKPVAEVGDTFTPELKSQVDDIIHLADKMEVELKKRHPEGFNLVGIGRSPSFIIELFKEKGYDAKSCALSGLMNGEFDIAGRYPYLKQLNPEDVKAYAQYLDEMGLSAEKVKASAKPFVFIDYTRTGESLRAFQSLLGRPEIGIRENVEFLSLNKDLLPNQTIAEKSLIMKLWENLGIKKFAFVPSLEISELGRANSISKGFKPDEIALKILEYAKKSIKFIK